MTTAASQRKPAWQAELNWESRWIPVAEDTPEDAPAGRTGETVEGAAQGTAEGEPVVSFLKVWDCVVEVSAPDCVPLRFRVNRHRGRSLTVTDSRDRFAGTAGVTGLWGTLPPLPANRPASLTLTAFQAELARLVGAERAAEIVRTIRGEFFLDQSTTFVRDRNPTEPRA
jgi:hypothetical protein